VPYSVTDHDMAFIGLRVAILASKDITPLASNKVAIDAPFCDREQLISFDLSQKLDAGLEV
jgi:hypothetical protein